VSRENRVTRVELRANLMIATGLADEHVREWARELIHDEHCSVIMLLTLLADPTVIDRQDPRPS
jgi:hypothetical protein